VQKVEDSQKCSNNNTGDLQPKPLSFTAICYGAVSFFGFIVFGYFYWQAHYCFRFSFVLLFSLAVLGLLIGGYDFYKLVQNILNFTEQAEEFGLLSHSANNVPLKYPLTSYNYRGTVIVIGRSHMANVLPMERQIAVIGALAEGSGIRQIERMTGINRNTIMNLGVRVGKGCASLLDQKMRIPCIPLCTIRRCSTEIASCLHNHLTCRLPHMTTAL
jgi:hypothetical protein